MHDGLNELERVAARARLESAPEVDVVNRVLMRIQQQAAPRRRSLAVFAMGSLATATGLSALSFSALYTLSDMLGNLFQVVPSMAL
ncbi:MAG: hypothetical protein JXR94_01960 [Candidatus Hydrogenedentes bacterium]|nr:hypothetical protein [Candidatus Hydrogenedentota bacterium]